MEIKKMTFIDPEKVYPKKKNDRRPASYIRKEFKAEKSVKKATLHMTALGVYKAFLNGEELDDRMLLPGFTNYNARLQVQEYDVTDRVKKGENALGVILGEGWYRGCIGVMSNPNYYGDKLGLAVKLVLVYKDGSKEIVETDKSWKATQDGPIQQNDIKTFETVDMTKDLGAWTEPGYDDKAWHSCKKKSYSGKLIPHEGVPVLEKERFSPKVVVTPNGETVLDFTQNLAGHVEFTVTGRAGQTVKLEMGEAFDEHGNFTVKNLSDDTGPDGMSTLGQTLTYTLTDGTQTYKSQFLISGYRLVRLTDWPEEVKPENFTSIAVYSDMKPTGSFACSSDMINQFASNTRWSWHSNSVEIPTDCPTRERAGWTGDINVYCESATYQFDTRQFLKKYLEDMKSHQLKNGSLPYIVPVVEILPGKLNRFANDSAGWSDALVNIPMTLYDITGDLSLIELVYDAAKKFVDYDIDRSKKGRKNYLLTAGFHWGEWLEPGRPMPADIVRGLIKTDSEVSTAWLYQSTRQISEMAALLGKKDDEKKYAELAEKVRKAYRKEYLKGGKVRSDRQCRYVRPVFMGLADPEECKTIIADLDKMVRKNDYKIGTGFLTTYKILQTLTDYGYAETAYRMMENEEYPSWLYEVKKGATTTWENWLGINDEGVPYNSLNHYANGASIAWLYKYVGGIRPAAPGYEKILIQPVPGGTLTWARTSYDSAKGMISTVWKLDGKTFKLHVEVPKGVETQVVLPNGETFAQTKKSADYSCKFG